MLTRYESVGSGWRPWSRANALNSMNEALAGSLVYDTGFPSSKETAGNPGSNPGGRTMFQNLKFAASRPLLYVKAYNPLPV